MAFGQALLCATLALYHQPTVQQPIHIMNPAYAGIAAILLYLLGSGLQVRDYRARRTANREQLLWVALPAVALHGVTAWFLVNSPAGLNLGLYSAACLTTFILAALVLIGSIRAPLQNLFLFVFPLSTLGILAGISLSSTFTPITTISGALLLHIMLSVMAYTVLLFAACQSLVLRTQEKALRDKRDISVLKMLPPLQTMESILFQWLFVGVLLLTLAIGSGFLFLDDMFGQPIHHTVLSIASWVAFTTLLIGRARFGWRGATATRWTLAGFVLLLLGYLGSKFVVEVLLQR